MRFAVWRTRALPFGPPFVVSHWRLRRGLALREVEVGRGRPYRNFSVSSGYTQNLQRVSRETLREADASYCAIMPATPPAANLEYAEICLGSAWPSICESALFAASYDPNYTPLACATPPRSKQAATYLDGRLGHDLDDIESVTCVRQMRSHRTRQPTAPQRTHPQKRSAPRPQPTDPAPPPRTGSRQASARQPHSPP